MNIGFVVGEFERHQMEISFDQKSGDLRMLMDGTPVLHELARLAKEPVQHYELSIGALEKHRLALDLTYGSEREEPGSAVVPRLSLAVSPVAASDVAPDSLPLSATDNILVASTSASL